MTIAFRTREENSRNFLIFNPESIEFKEGTQIIRITAGQKVYVLHTDQTEKVFKEMEYELMCGSEFVRIPPCTLDDDESREETTWKH